MGLFKRCEQCGATCGADGKFLDLTEGLQIVAEILTEMQEARGELLRRGDKRSLRLAQILENGKEAMAEDFTKTTLESQ